MLERNRQTNANTTRKEKKNRSQNGAVMKRGEKGGREERGRKMAAIQIEHNRISSGEMLRTGEEMEGGGWRVEGRWKGVANNE